LLVVPSISNAETIDVDIEGIDDGVRTTKQQDYKEAVLFAKRGAIERAGVKIKALTTAEDLVMNSDYIESKAEAVLLPGYIIEDFGYRTDGIYLVRLVGKIRTVSEGIDSRELRYAKCLLDKGDKSRAREIIADIINNSKNDNTVAEAMYCKVLWNFASRDTLEKLKTCYPNSKYVSRAEAVLAEREAKIGKETGSDGRFVAYDKGVVLDMNTGLIWAARDNGNDISWYDAITYCENYKGDGYTDWRMPTQDELAEIYDKNRKNRHGYHVTRLIEITGCCPWASDTRGSEAGGFNFSGGYRYWGRQSGSGYGLRVLPVRGGK
jgi:hypothetical protein